MVFIAIFPLTLLLSFIRTLARLSVASLLANLLQATGLALIVEYLLRDYGQLQLKDRDLFRPLSETALGFGSIMFSFEGISVVLPLYARMRHPRLMSTWLGTVNVSFFVIVSLNFLMGLLGYLRFGRQTRDSITLNLPATPLYDSVRAMFTASILLSYPLQFYVPNEIIWNWAKRNWMIKPVKKTTKRRQTGEDCNGGGGGGGNNIKGSLVALPPGSKVVEEGGSIAVIQGSIDTTKGETGQVEESSEKIASKLAEIERQQKRQLASGGKLEVEVEENEEYEWPEFYEYYSRLMLVLLTFTLAISVPKLNLLMDLIGSFSGAALCLTIPASIHLAAFWEDTKGFKKVLMILIDGLLIVGSIAAGLCGSLSSLVSIVRTFNH